MDIQLVCDLCMKSVLYKNDKKKMLVCKIEIIIEVVAKCNFTNVYVVLVIPILLYLKERVFQHQVSLHYGTNMFVCLRPICS